MNEVPKPTIEIESDDFYIRLSDRRYFWMLLAVAFTVLFEGKAVLKFKRKV